MDYKRKIQEYLRGGRFTMVKVSGESTVTKCTSRIQPGDQWDLFYGLVGNRVPNTFNWTAKMKQRVLSKNVLLLDVEIKSF